MQKLLMYLNSNTWYWVKGTNHLREYCTPNQKLACFVLYLKIINTLLKIIYVS